MKQVLIIALFFVGIGMGNLFAQNQQKTVPPQTPSMFNLDQLLGIDLNELFNSDALKFLEEEMESTESIWGEFIDPSFMDSTLMRLNDPTFGMSLDALMQHLNLQLNDQEGFGGMLQELLKNFNMPMNTMPFNLNPDVLPEDFDGEGWEIVPNVPKQKPQKKGVSVI